MKITIAHSPDADDAFMFYPLVRGRIDTEGFQFEHTLQDIQRCNEEALQRKYDVTAISFAAYPSVAHHYLLLTSGASMGEKAYGPLLVAKKPVAIEDLPKKKIAIPGTRTTAALLLKLLAPQADNLIVIPFQQILSAVRSGEAEVGLLIHEGQLTYRQAGLVEVLNFGAWWWEKEQLPLPLGGNVIARDLPPAVRSQVNRLLKKSIQYALTHRQEALDYALQFARGLDPKIADRFVGMYVNERTLDYGEVGREAVERLLQRAVDCGLLPRVQPEYIT